MRESAAKTAPVARLLLVLPSHNFLATLRRILTRCGYEVDDASTGEEAMRMLDCAGYDAIISDVHLPGNVCGLTLAQQVRNTGRQVPIIFLTESETARIRSALPAFQPVECMGLPLDVDRLKLLIANRCGAS